VHGEWILPCSSLENRGHFFFSHRNWPRIITFVLLTGAQPTDTTHHLLQLTTKTRQLSATLSKVYDRWWHCKEIPCSFSSVAMATAASQTRWCWITFVSCSAQRELRLMQLLQLPTPTSNRSNDRLEMFQWLETRIISSGCFAWNLLPPHPHPETSLPLPLLSLSHHPGFLQQGRLIQLWKGLIAYFVFLLGVTVEWELMDCVLVSCNTSPCNTMWLTGLKAPIN